MIAPRAVSQRLADLGIVLPGVVPPVASYLPAVVDGPWVWVSGQLPMSGGALVATGRVDARGSKEGAVDPTVATRAARTCALNALAAAASAVGDVDQLTGVVKVVGFVASARSFTGQPGVINGASDFFVEVFGEAGRHARSAVGVSALPLGAPVEVEVVFRRQL